MASTAGSAELASHSAQSVDTVTWTAEVVAPGDVGKPVEEGKAHPQLLRRLTDAASTSKDADIEALPESWISEYVSSQALWAADLLRELVVGEAAGTYDKLNPAVINSCEGLTFIKTSKGGFGVTVAHGYGFVIKKLSQDQYGNSQWSQPLFFVVNQAGLGISAGFQRCQSVIALLSVGSIDVFKNGTTSMGTDLGLFSTDGALVGMSGGASMGTSQHLGLSVTNTRSAFCYSKVDGVFLTLSLHGSAVYHDKESNAALYGKDYDADKILSSKGQFVKEMLPLLRVINSLGRQAMTSS